MATDTSGYRQFCPIALTSEILCNRWTTLILRAFFCGASKYSEIQKGAPHMSSAILSSRLRQLEEAGIILRSENRGQHGAEYSLTESGKALFPILDQMGIWAQDWLRRDIVADKNLDPDVLFWELRQLTVMQRRFPDARRVVRFVLGGVPSKKRCYWLIFEPNDAEVCVRDPGFDTVLTVSAHIRTLVEIWLGHVSLADAKFARKLTLEGEASEIEAFSDWFMLSHFSKVGLATGPKSA